MSELAKVPIEGPKTKAALPQRMGELGDE